MGKNNKEIVEEEPKLSLKERKEKEKKDEELKYAHVVGDSRDFIIKILKQIEKTPRIKSKFQPILDKVEKFHKETNEKNNVDVQVDALREQLKEFIEPADPRNTNFINYDYKFEFEPYVDESAAAKEEDIVDEKTVKKQDVSKKDKKSKKEKKKERQEAEETV